MIKVIDKLYRKGTLILMINHGDESYEELEEVPVGRIVDFVKASKDERIQIIKEAVAEKRSQRAWDKISKAVDPLIGIDLEE